MIFGVDLSHYQDGIAVATVVSEGYEFVICKATEGTSYQDPKFVTLTNQATARGAIPGAYHFLRAGDGKEQARRFHARVAAQGGPEEWLCACDNESDATWSTTRDFFTTWAELTDGHPLIMYTGSWWWDAAGRRWDGASLTPYLWHSHYVSGSGYGSVLYQSVPESWWSPGYGGWDQATLLQFTSSAQVAGRKVDVDAFRGTLAQLRQLTTRRSSMEQTDLLTAETGYAKRTIGHHFGDLQRLRGYLIGETGASADVPPDGSPLAAIVEAANAILAVVGPESKLEVAVASLTEANRAAIVDQLTERILPHLETLNRLAERLAQVGEVLSTVDTPTT